MGNVPDRQQRILKLVERNLRATIDGGMTRKRIENHEYDGVHMELDGHDLLNFGSCAYSGLDTDPRTKAGAIDAVERYGPVYSSSTIYASVPLYDELEDLLSRMLGANVIAMATTTLAHVAWFLVGFKPTDRILADIQVHATVHQAGDLLKSRGYEIDLLPHNDWDKLEAAIAEASETAERVWYLADGIYSMHGDMIDMDVINDLMDRYPKLHLYIDDAHGISWAGPYGRGHVLGNRPMDDRMVVAGSLAKGFGSGGAFLALPNDEAEEMVRTTSGAMFFSGPVHPAQLGAAIAATRIHLSPEIPKRQEALRERIALTNKLLKAYDLPIIDVSETPIFFVEVGAVDKAVEVAVRVKDAGFYLNMAVFPAVPHGRAGIRFAVTLHHGLEDIELMIETLSVAYRSVIEEEMVIELTDGADDPAPIRPAVAQ